MKGALRLLVFRLLWTRPVKMVLERVPLVRRIYDGWRRQHPFDRMYGLDTSGAIQANDLGFDPNMAAHSSPYGGSQPSIVRRCLAILPDPAEYVFVDLGCGKGRPLLVATEFPFQRVVGVEIAPRLAEIARQNAATLSRQRGRQVSIEVQVGDATTTTAPAVRVVYFLYNPFDAVLIGGVAGNIAAQLGERLEHAFIVYYNPVHAQVFDRSPHFARWSARRLWYASDEVGYGPDLDDSVLIWQTVPGRYPPQPGAGRQVIVDRDHTRAMVVA
jgi:SAM-dependent methyltransferase